MTTYYISTAGSDSNNGLGPDASHASNKPFLTLGKVLNTGSPLAAGDTVYVGPGYYYSAGNYTVLGTISSTGSPTQIIGDPTNAQGFKDGSGVRLAAGIPWITTRTTGDTLDGPLSSSNNMFNCSTNDPSGLQFKFLCLEVNSNNSTSVLWNCDGNAGSDNLFQDCYLICSTVFNYTTPTAPTAGRNFTVRRCVVIGRVFNIFTSTAAATANADLGLLCEESLIIGTITGGLGIGASGGGNVGSGLTFANCTVVCAGDPSGNANVVRTLAGRCATTGSTINVIGCMIFNGGGATFNGGTSGHITDGGYNRIFQQSSTVYTNTTQAGTSLITTAPNLVLPHLVNWGLEMPRPDFLGWTDAALSTQAFSASGRTTADLRGRTVRPWGAGASIGCWQAQSVAQDTGSAISTGGANSLKITGAGEVSLYIPVDAAGMTVSVATKSSSYGGSSYPQMVVVANPACGVTSDTTVTASSASEQIITTATITPTSKGVLEVRLISRSTSTTSSTYFDVLTSP